MLDTKNLSVTKKRRASAAAGATSALGLGAGVLLAAAQSPTDVQTSTLAEVVVTAQRQEENLQSVPIAISVFTAEQRELLGIVNPQDIANFTPGLSYQNYPNRIFLRGVGRLTNTVGNDPGIAVYHDGFYTAETAVIASPSFFVDRVEVLRGPQGTLYGRNSIGGAVNLVTRRPTDQFEARLHVAAGNYERVEVMADVAGPINEFLRYRLAGSHTSQGEGFVENISGDDLYKGEQSYAEAQLAGNIAESANFWIKYAHAENDSNAYWAHEISPYFTSALSSGLYPNPQFGLTTQNPATDDIHRVDVDYAGRMLLRDYHTVVAELNWDLGGVALRYVGGYNTFNFLMDRDADQTSRTSHSLLGFPVSTTIIEEIVDDKESYSHELTLASSDESALGWIAGLYYWHENEHQPYTRYDPNNAAAANVLYPGDTGLLPADPNPRRAYVFNDTSLSLQSRAAFAQLEYSLGDWTTTVGARYSRDEKRGYEATRLVLFQPFFLPDAALEIAGPSTGVAARTLADEWSGWTGRLGLDWQPDRDLLVYGSISTGYKSGGFNLGSLSSPPNDRVDEESILAYEIGIKKTFSRLRVNAATFYYDYRDLQLVRNLMIGPVFVDGFVNAPRARSYGAELEATVALHEDFELLFNYSYLNAQVQELCCLPNLSVAPPPSGIPVEEDLSGRSLVLSPPHKATANATYTWHVGSGRLLASGTYSWIDAQYGSIFNEPAARIPAHDTVDLRTVWLPQSGAYRVTGYVRNLFDEDSWNSVVVGDSSGGFAVSVSPNEPQTFGVEVEFYF